MNGYAGVVDVPDFNPTSGEVISDQAPMAPPPESLSAHEHERRSQRKRRGKRSMKLRRFHVISIAAECIQSPTCVDRVRRGVTPAAEVDDVSVVDAGGAERGGQCIAAELRMPARAWKPTYVNERRDGLRRQERDEDIDRTRRMPDRVDRGRRVRDVSE
jgi:hypothetical protein